MDTKEMLGELRGRLKEIDEIDSASGVISWDQQTYMPPGGAPARADALARLGKISHQKFTDPAIGKLLTGLAEHEKSLPYESDDASLIRVTRRDYDLAVNVPSDFLSKFYSHKAQSYKVWSNAKPKGDFDSVQPYLEKTLEMSRQLADFFPGYEHIADPLIDYIDYGMKTSKLLPLFSELRSELVPIVEAIASKQAPDDSMLRKSYSPENQLNFGFDIAKAFGFDTQRGRQDMTPHPFTTKFSVGDVRITTRVEEGDLKEALFSTLHETGHALYYQGIDAKLDGTPLADGASSGVHESQSRLWENIVGRSYGFWQHYYPKLQKVFPDQLGGVGLDKFYPAINKVQKSLIRTKADEVTYNLHVILRFDLEIAMLEDRLKVSELPSAWNERLQNDMGLTPKDNSEGVMQDVHWYMLKIGGAFQCYTIGNILSAQFYESALKAHPEIDDEIATGKFDTLHTWLHENIYVHGRKFTPEEIVLRATGQPMTIKPYIRYLKKKYGEIYDL